MVGAAGEPTEPGRRLHQAACEQGLARAREKLVVSDGAPWIWNVAQDRWKGAVEVLDFYHASQHVWALGEAVHGEREAARGWPIGSGPVESACLQRQGRFKRSGQSWTPPGSRRLCALIEARQNGHWDRLWNQ